MNEVRVSVGSAPPAAWVVQAPSVLPMHFEFYWDGKGLWVSPPSGGEVKVDGERVSNWRQLVGRSRLEFGGAAMLVETSSAVAIPAGGLQGGQTGSVELSAGDLMDFDDDATQMVAADREALLAPPKAPVIPAAPAMPAAPEPAMRATMPLNMADAPEGLLPSGPATQIFDPAAAGIILGDSEPPPGPVDRPSLSTSALETDVLPGRQMSKFAAPPPPTEPKPKRDMWELPPRRTLIMAGVALVVGVALLAVSYVKKQQKAALLQRQRQAALVAEENRAAEVAETARAAATAARQARIDRHARMMTEAESATAELRAAARDAVFAEAPEDDEFDDSSLERRANAAEQQAVHRYAAQRAARNEHETALGVYLYLAREYPQNPTYGQIAAVLEQKVGRGGE